MRRFIRILGVFLIRGNLNNNRWRVETSLILITVLTTGTVSGLTTLKTFKIIKDQKAWIKWFSLWSSPLCYQQFRNSDFPFSSPSPLRNLAKVTLLLCCDILFVKTGCWREGPAWTVLTVNTGCQAVTLFNNKSIKKSGWG